MFKICDRFALLNQQLTRCIFLCTAGRVIAKIGTSGLNVKGLTLVGGLLYGLLERSEYQLAVFSDNDYRSLGMLNLPGLCTANRNADMISCVRYSRFYACVGGGSSVHVFDLDGRALSMWSVQGTPCGLSVIPGSGNLLVTCKYPSCKLVELNVDNGEKVHEIILPPDIEGLKHAVKLTTGEYVVGFVDDLYGLCTVDGKGKVTRTFDDSQGELTLYPSYLAVDEDTQFIFVADYWNHQVALFSPTLEFARVVVGGVPWPDRLYLDQTKHRLYVGVNDVHREHYSGVVVCQF